MNINAAHFYNVQLTVINLQYYFDNWERHLFFHPC